MKKIIARLLIGMMALGSLTACSTSDTQTMVDTDTTEKLSVVCTIFPEYDWMREILGDRMENAELTMLLDNGVDLHSYQPTTDDIIKISTCDMFVYVGGESDAWVEDALKEATNQDMVVVNLMDVLGDTIKQEEMVEGMEEHEHEHEHEDGEEHEHEEAEAHEDGEEHEHEKAEAHEDGEHEHELEYDEHVWLSLKNAEILCNYMAEKLGTIDPENTADYTANANAYIEKLSTLDAEYQKTVEEAPQKTLLFGDRFPFRYLVDDYGLSYYAAFVGCSAETEASFETIAFLSGKVDELGLHTVLTIDGVQHEIAETVIQNTKEKNQTVLSLDSMQSVTAQEMESGITYLSIMEKNLDVLKSALH